MRRAFTYAEFQRMIQELRLHPPKPGESVRDLSWRLRPAGSHSRPEHDVTLNVLRAAGFKIHRRLTMRSRPLLRYVRNLRKGRTIDPREMQIEYVFTHPKLPTTGWPIDSGGTDAVRTP